MALTLRPALHQLPFAPKNMRFVPFRWRTGAAGGKVHPNAHATYAMDFSPLIAVHMTTAIGAVVTGPVALWARKGAVQRPRLHRAFGYAWVTLMLVAATSAIFIRSSSERNLAGFSVIHLLILLTYGTLFLAFWSLAEGRIRAHRKCMQGLYVGACVVAGVFTLAPGRYLGQLVWGQWLGLL